MHKNQDYIVGDLESSKFQYKKEDYYKGMETIKALNYSTEDLIHYFPCFTGSMTLSRYFVLYELYKKTLGLAGHIAEVGVYKGAGTLFFSKLLQIFEPHAYTQVHGFDWFEGNKPGEDEDKIVAGADVASYENLMKLIESQQIGNIAKIHKLDVVNELDNFFKKHPHLQFKVVFLDAGLYDVVKACLPHFWDRLNKGGILILDQYNFEVTPGETRAVNEFFADKGGVQIRALDFGWMPTAYIIKE